MNMTTEILREMTEGTIPRHSSDRELLRLFADRLWASFCEDMAAQYRRGVEEGERHSTERANAAMKASRLVRIDDVLYALHSIGGCDADEEWSKGYDAAIDDAYSCVEDMEPASFGEADP